jgi:hypothetical protein
MTRPLAPAQLDRRLVGEAVYLSLHPGKDGDIAAIIALGQLAAGNRTALERAIGSVVLKLDGGPSDVGERALGFLRQALDNADGPRSV